MNLFEQWETLPPEIIDLIDKQPECMEYEDCAKFVEELEKNGYTCEYGLDAVPFNIKKL